MLKRIDVSFFRHAAMTDGKGHVFRMWRVKKERATMMMIQGDRRLGIERRMFDYSGYYPERRKDKERRSGAERRNKAALPCQDYERRCTD